MSTMSYSTANWHWKNKTVTPWAKEWFERELVLVEVQGADGAVVRVERVVEIDGDVELGRRKSKLITIYDCKVVLNWKGTAADGSEASGRLVVPEVSHEITLDGLSDYAYEWSITSDASAPSASVLYALAKSLLPAALEVKFTAFPAALVETHGKDIIVGSTEPSRTASPAPAASASPQATPASSSSTASAPKVVKKVEKNKVNAALVEVEATFQAAADDLFSLLTDEKRIPAWSRAPAKSAAQPGTEYTLFGGGVRGKYLALTPGQQIVQTWALQSPTWPDGHEATLTTTLVQSTDSTKVTFALDGVPTGSEDEIRRNLEGYYVHGFKSIGYVQLFPSAPVFSSSYTTSRRASQKSSSSTPSSKPPPTLGSRALSAGLALLVLGAALAVPLLYSSSSPPVSPK